MKKFNATIKKIFKAVETASVQMANYQDRESVLCYYANRTMKH